MIKLTTFEERKKVALEKVVAAVKSGNEDDAKEALTAFYEAIYDSLKADFDVYQKTQDETVLAKRGYRQLTSEEKKFYEALAKNVKASDAKQAFLSDIPDGAMPTTIIEDVFRELKEEHPLLSKISCQYVGNITKWILADHSSQKAVWGKITDAIVKEITSGLKEVDVTQNKLTAFVRISLGIVEMGPVFLDAYIRGILKEAIALGLEDGIVNGTGINEPIGMIRDIHDGVTFSTTDGYPEKTAVKVKNFGPKAYGELLAPLAKTEKGNSRSFNEVILICSMTDYLTKVMPATTTVNAQGTYVKDIFPFATDVTTSAVLSEGKAVIGIPEEYYLLMGGAKEGTIVYSDETEFLEDNRLYKIKQYAAGQAYDNTCFIVLDISKLEEFYITVLNKSVENAAEETTPTV